MWRQNGRSKTHTHTTEGEAKKITYEFLSHARMHTNIINDVGGRKVLPFEKWHFGGDAACLSWIM